MSVPLNCFTMLINLLKSDFSQKGEDGITAAGMLSIQN